MDQLQQQSLIFTKSPLGQSSEMCITLNGTKIELTQLASKQGQCNSQLLDSSRGYSLKLAFNRPFGQAKSGYFAIGLLQNNKIASHWVCSDSTQSCFHSPLNSGARIICKGGLITGEGVRNKTHELEFQWCVERRKFYISDSSYSNYCYADEEFFIPNEQYCFAIMFANLAESDWKVTVLDFKEIDPKEVPVFN